MRLPFIAFTLSAAAVGFAPLHAQPPAGKADELAKFRGEWVVTKVELPPGQPELPPDAFKSAVFSVTGDRFVVSFKLFGGDLEQHYDRFGVDPSKSPARIDLIAAKRDTRTEPFPRPPVAGSWTGIYRLEGDSLVLAFSTAPEFPVPTEFQAVTLKYPNPRRVEPAGTVVIHLTRKK